MAADAKAVGDEVARLNNEVADAKNAVNSNNIIDALGYTPANQ